MSTEFLTKVLSSKDFQTLCYAILFILSIANLIVIFVIVSTRCDAIFQSGDDCGVGWGWVWLAGGIFVIGVVSAWGLYRGWRAGHLKFFKII